MENKYYINKTVKKVVLYSSVLAIGVAGYKLDKSFDHLNGICYLTKIIGKEHQVNSIIEGLSNKEKGAYYVFQNDNNLVQIISKREVIAGWTKLGEYVPKQDDAVILSLSIEGIKPKVTLRKIDSSWYRYSYSSMNDISIGVLDDSNYEIWKSELQQYSYRDVDGLSIHRHPISMEISNSNNHYSIYTNNLNYKPIENSKENIKKK